VQFNVNAQDFLSMCLFGYFLIALDLNNNNNNIGYRLMHEVGLTIDLLINMGRVQKAAKYGLK